MFNNRPWVHSIVLLYQECACREYSTSDWYTTKIMIRSRTVVDAETREFSCFLTQIHHHTTCRKCGGENMEIFEGCPKTLEEIM